MQNQKTNPTIRNSNLEMLRILCMILIVAHHYSMHGLLLNNAFDAANSLSFNHLFTQMFSLGGKLGVNCFILISGYFLIVQNTFTLKRILRFWLQVFFYSVGIYLLFVVLHMEPFSTNQLLHFALPITYNNYWFASAYFVMLILAPFMNKLLCSLDDKAYRCLLGVMLLFWCIIPTVTSQTFQGNDLLWFLTIYALAGYIRLHENNFRKRSRLFFLLCAASYILILLLITAYDILGETHAFFRRHAVPFSDMQSLPLVALSLFLFLGFLFWEMKPSRIINFLAAASFGVYLIHDNTYIRSLLWKELLQPASYADSPSLWLHAIISVLAVWAACTAIDLLRRYFFEKPILKCLEKLPHTLRRYIFSDILH